MNAAAENKAVPPDQIRIGQRHRKDMGDVAALAESMKDLGLLHPVVIRPDNQLVSGARRLAAAKKLKWPTVPCRVVENLEEALALLKAERDENVCRKDFTPEEGVAIGREIAELLRPEQEAKQKGQGSHGSEGGRGRKKNPSGNLPEGNGNGRHERETRTQAAEAAGMSPRTYGKAEAVVKAAEAEPEKYGDLKEKMNATGKVDPVHQELKRRQNPPPKPPPPKYPHSDKITGWLDVVEGQLHVINVDFGGIDKLLAEPDKWDWKKVKRDILPALDDIARTLTRFREAIASHASK